MANYPQFTTAANCLPIQITSANTASDGSGLLNPCFSAGTSGSRVDSVTFRNGQLTQAASSSMLGKVFLSNASNASPWMVGEVLIAAATRSATVLGATSTITFSPPLVIASGQVLYATISVRASAADDTSVTVFGGNF